MDDMTVAAAAYQLSGTRTSYHTRSRISQIATVAIVAPLLLLLSVVRIRLSTR